MSSRKPDPQREPIERDEKNPVLLRAGLCSRGHGIAWKSDIVETPEGFRCRRCAADAKAERVALRDR